MNPGLIGRCVKKPVINAEDQKVEEDVELKPHNQDQEVAVLQQIKEKHVHLKLNFGRNTTRRSYVNYQNAHVCTLADSGFFLKLFVSRWREVYSFLGI